MSIMNRIQPRSIQVQIALWTGVCLFLAAAIIITYAAIALHTMAMEEAEEQAIAVARSEAGNVKSEIEGALSTARTLAQALSVIKAKNLDLGRDEVSEILRQVTARNPHFVGTFTLWEPNAFDGRDAEYAGQEPYDQTGRFAISWNRNEQGNIRTETLVNYEAQGPGDYYQLPKQTRQECIIDPYPYSVQDEHVLATSLVIPIMAKGQFYGVVGVILDVDFFQELADGVDVHDGSGVLALVSNNGTLAGVTGQAGLVGGYVTTFHEEFEAELLHIQEEKEHTEHITHVGDEMGVFVPVKFGHTTTPWYVNLNVPYDEVTANATGVTWRLVGISALLTTAGLVLLWFVTLRIATPIQRITAVAHAVAGGDLEVEVNVQSRDETGMLAEAFNHMISRLRQTLHQEQRQRERLQTAVREYVAHMEKVGSGNLSARLTLDDLAESVKTASDDDDPLIVLGRNLNEMTDSLQHMISQINGAANNLSSAAAEILSTTIQQASGANEQSAAITQTSTTVDELKTIAEQSVMRAQEVANASQRTVEVSHNGQQAMQDTIGSMHEIKARVEGIAENILALSEQTQQIGAIISTVNDIAAQSNILALNASVEAARAGEAGKGFAVVAVEVRNLAEQSRQATAQVRAILSDIQKATNATVMATEEGTKGVDEGAQLARQAQQAIEQLTTVIQDSAQAATQMVAGGRQQAAGVEQVALAIQQINQAMTTNLTSTRETERSAQSLNDLARSLIETVKQY